MARITLAASIFMLLPAALAAQVHCISQEVTQRMLREKGMDAPFRGSVPVPVLRGGGPYTVPVVVHVVWNTAAENVPDAYITDVIDQMNEDYAAENGDMVNLRPVFAPFVGDAEITFCLAGIDPQGDPTTGITRYFTSTTWFDPLTDPDGVKQAPAGVDAWDPFHYLNVWVCDLNSGLPPFFAIGGYANLPAPGIVGDWNDGLVLDYVYGVGPGTRTATHEVGHYLGLLHPWGLNGGCADDDGFADTPMTEGPTYPCTDPTAESCTVLTQYENFMDYSSCRVMFSLEQTAYMNGTLGGLRSALPTDDMCVVTSVQEFGAGQYLSVTPQGDQFLLSWPASFKVVDVALIDPSGRLVLLEPIVGRSHELSVSNMAPGLYRAIVRSGSASLSVAVVIGL